MDSRTVLPASKTSHDYRNAGRRKSLASPESSDAPPRSGRRPGTPEEGQTPVPGGVWGLGGRYRILRKLGSGGTGSVYLAWDALLRREVALKAMDVATVGEELLQRANVLREARAAAIEHERIARVYDIGEEGGALFVAMEFVHGPTLRTWMETHATSAEEALDISGQIADGLAALHERGIVHRDLKPENIMLSPGGVKLLDFGLAKAMFTVDGAGNTRPATAVELSTPRRLSGTPGYMAPEQWERQPVDERTDIFALGVVMFELVERRRPFPGHSFWAIMRSTLNTSPTFDLGRWTDSPALLQVVRRALSPIPKDRWCRAKMIVDALQAAPASLPPSLAPVATPLGVAYSPTMPAGTFAALSAHLAFRRAGRLGVIAAVSATTVYVGVWFGVHRTRGEFLPAPRGMTLIEQRAVTERPAHYAPAGGCPAGLPPCDPAAVDSDAEAGQVLVAAFCLDIAPVANDQLTEVLNELYSAGVDRDDADGLRAHASAFEGPASPKVFAAADSGDIEYTSDGIYRPRLGRGSWAATRVPRVGARVVCAALGKRLPTEDEREVFAQGPSLRVSPTNEARASEPRHGGFRCALDATTQLRSRSAGGAVPVDARGR